MGVTILFFVLIMGLIVISHEFVHFLIAKANGIHVVEFAVGFGPKLCGFTKNGTEYTLRLLPLGGACRFEGTDLTPEEMKELREKDPEGGDGLSEGAFNKASVWARIGTVLAGPFFNFLLGLIFALVVVSNTYTVLPVVQSVSEGGGCETAGIMAGDVIKKVDGHSIYLYNDLLIRSVMNRGESVEFVYERNGETYKTMVTPAYSEADGRYLFGLTGGEYVKADGIVDSVKFGLYEMHYAISSTYSALGGLFTGKTGKDDVAGPLGVAEVVGDTYENTKEYGATTVVMNMMYLVMLLSVNLGIINLLPLPALDGGRLVFLLIELVRGKPVPPEKEGMVHVAGMILLLILAAFVFFNDITKLFR